MAEAPSGVYLRPLPDEAVPARHSAGARRRARALQEFLRGLQLVARERLATADGCELWVVGRDDWRRLFSYPYGLPFVRNRAGGVTLVAAADYPQRMLRRFDPLLLTAARSGTPPPGDVREFLDLLLGHEWGHAAANLSGLRTRVRWIDEFVATYAFLQALRETGDDAVRERFEAWSAVGSADGAQARLDLGAFDSPRVRLGLENLLWFQGTLTERAAGLSARRGWGFLHELRAALPERRHRGDVARALLEVEPSFKDWFAVFGNGRRVDEPATSPRRDRD